MLIRSQVIDRIGIPFTSNASITSHTIAYKLCPHKSNDAYEAIMYDLEGLYTGLIVNDSMWSASCGLMPGQ